VSDTSLGLGLCLKSAVAAAGELASSGVARSAVPAAEDLRGRLFLGTIPIVRSSALDPLHDGEDLPVARVEAWDEVTPARLAAWHAEPAPSFTPDLTRRLTADHWIAKLRAAAARLREPGDRS
jgi:hypothetical protein